MRGIPNNPVPCTKCGAPDGFPNCGVCRRCRPPHVRKKYCWTPDLDARLRRIYAEHAGNRNLLGPAVTALAKHIGCPRYIVFFRAGTLRIRTSRGRSWTPQEIQFLRENASVHSLSYIQRALRRGYTSVVSKLSYLHISFRVTEGYSRGELQQLFCVSQKLLVEWIRRGWLRPTKDTNRISEEQVRRFIQKHPEQYSLKRVDEAWFKGIVFPAFGQHAHGMGDKVSHNPFEGVA